MIKIRYAIEEDEKDLLDWRNDESTIKTSISQQPVSKQDHSAWFANIIKINRCPLLIALEKNNKIGMVRFDSHDDHFIVSININPEFRGNGFGSDILILSEIFFFDKPSKIIANVKEDNIASIKLFKKSGYNLLKDTYLSELVFFKEVLT
jgi:RimJ/RimL family protein N-acetyltransferase